MAQVQSIESHTLPRVEADTLPRISIVTISYNQKAFLRECIESVLGQQYPRCEYIVIDAASPDGSAEVVRDFGERIDRFICEPDHGPADGLNKGFALAGGDVFGYINADDRLTPGALAFVAEYFAQHPDVDVLCGAIRIIDEAGRASWRNRTADKFDPARYAARVCTVGQQATFFRRSAYSACGGFNADNRICWDGELLVDLALTGARFATVRKILGDFRIYGASITGSGKFLDKLFSEHARIARKIQEHGVPVYPPLSAALHRFAYRLDLRRHLGYLTVR